MKSDINLEERELTIVCGADDNFAMPLSVTLLSALINLRAGVKANIIVIDGGIAKKNKEKVEQVFKRSGRTFDLQWIPFDLSVLKSVRVTNYISKAAYLRVLIPDLLPLEVSKVIYLDCDMIVEADLMSLWEMDFGGAAAMGVQDFCFPFVSTISVLDDFREFHLDEQTVYCNSGLLVFNLSYWRTHDLKSKVFAYLKKNRQALDQEGINIAVAGNWKVLDPCWNVTLSSISSFGVHLRLGQTEIDFYRQKFRQQPYIIHFTSHHKPWHTGHKNKVALTSFYYDQIYFQRFYYYLRHTRWFSSLSFAYWVSHRKAILLLEYKIPRRLSLLKKRQTRKLEVQKETIVNEA